MAPDWRMFEGMDHLPLIRFPGTQPFERVAALQRALVSARFEGRIPDVMLLLEHDPVITLGRRALDSYLLADREHLAERGLPVVVADRGGDVTWHGPGQFVLYPIFQCDPRGAPAGHLARLERIAIETARRFGVEAFRRDGFAGAWTREGKLAAIGFRIRRGITFHGLSFNVAPLLDGFSYIVACGLENERVTSLEALLGEFCPSMDAVAAAFEGVTAECLARDVCLTRPDSQGLTGGVFEVLQAFGVND